MISLPGDTYYSYKDMMKMTGMTRRGLELRAKKLNIEGYRIAPECLMFGFTQMLLIIRNTN